MVEEIIIIIISSVVIILGWSVHRKTEKIKILENQLSEKKYKTYAEIVSVFYGLFKDIKNDKKTDLDLMTNILLDTKKDFLMYGSDKVYFKFNKWLCDSNVMGQNSKKQMNSFLEFMLEIRKDMQGGNTKLTKRDILINIMQDKKEVDEFLLNINEKD